MYTRFEYTVCGKQQSEVVFTPSVLAFNRAANRLLAIADRNTLRATTVENGNGH